MATNAATICIFSLTYFLEYDRSVGMWAATPLDHHGWRTDGVLWAATRDYAIVYATIHAAEKSNSVSVVEA